MPVSPTTMGVMLKKTAEKSHPWHVQCERLLAGYRFTLEDHPNDEHNRGYLITELKHVGEQPQVLEEGAHERGGWYSNQILGINSTGASRQVCGIRTSGASARRQNSPPD